MSVAGDGVLRRLGPAAESVAGDGEVRQSELAAESVAGEGVVRRLYWRLRASLETVRVVRRTGG
ncbi:MAG: hypothetical protein ACR2QO_17275 [Acidimicrobiales bacterium]